MYVAKSREKKMLCLQSMSTASGHSRVHVTPASITLKHEETSRTSHMGQGWTAAHCYCFWGLQSPNKHGNPPWGRSPAQTETLKLSYYILHLLLNISWHHIQQCLKQSSLPSLTRPTIIPDTAELLQIQNCASRARGHQILQRLKVIMHSLGLSWSCPLLNLTVAQGMTRFPPFSSIIF